jgi:hypothetical protein
MKGHLDPLSSQNYPADVECGLESNTTESNTTPGRRSKRTHHWTMTHSHFALMGGFAFEKSASGVNILPYDYNHVTLTSNALRKLANYEPDIIPDISAETIKSKSKTDWGARAWVTAQCLYFIFKVLARLSMGSPITVLELTTLIQVLYCLVFFTAWSRKPLDVTVPHFIQVDTDLKRQICAWMVMKSTLGANKSMKTDGKRTRMWLIYDKDTQSADNVQRPPTLISKPNQEIDCTEGIDCEESVLQRNPAHNEKDTSKISTSEPKYGFRLDPKGDYNNDYIFLDESDLECIRLASSLRERSQTAYEWKFSRRENIKKEEMLVTHISTFSPPEDGEMVQLPESNWFALKNVDLEFVRWCGILVAGSIFGLAHLLALNAPFPTQKQGMLWTASCIVTMSPLGFMLLYSTSYRLLLMFPEQVRVQNWPMFPNLCNGVDIAGILSVLILLAYGILLVVCRVYLLVGCILNFTHLPAEVYQKPKCLWWLP